MTAGRVFLDVATNNIIVRSVRDASATERAKHPKTKCSHYTRVIYVRATLLSEERERERKREGEGRRREREILG